MHLTIVILSLWCILYFSETLSTWKLVLLFNTFILFPSNVYTRIVISLFTLYCILLRKQRAIGIFPFLFVFILTVFNEDTLISNLLMLWCALPGAFYLIKLIDKEQNDFMKLDKRFSLSIIVAYFIARSILILL